MTIISARIGMKRLRPNRAFTNSMVSNFFL
jgi:hypothetical protein